VFFSKGKVIELVVIITLLITTSHQKKSSHAKLKPKKTISSINNYFAFLFFLTIFFNKYIYSVAER